MNNSVSINHSLGDDLVGVLIVVHNRKEDLFKLLHSLQCQKYAGYEILVIDNCSTDDISEVQNNPALEYIRLEENIGFVSGMIKGVGHLLNKNKYRFIWILDSDLEVASTALGRLVAVMKDRQEIGVAGCVIYNAFERDVVVEAGADVDLRTGIVSARYCNERRPELNRVMDVDFIASGGGGSLFRVEALKAIGLHDERYFFLWEDTDYCLCLKQYGYRVVIVSDAVVYHPPFTEKRNPNIYAYYGVRNPLLTVAKHSTGIHTPYYLFVNLCRYLRIGLFMLFSGRKSFARLTFRAILDYIAGRFGKAELEPVGRAEAFESSADLKDERRVVVLGLGGKDVVKAAIEFVRPRCCGQIMLVVQHYRRELLSEAGADEFITFDDRASGLFREYWKTGMEILRFGGCVINTDLTVVSPLSYFSFRSYDWDHARGQLILSSTSLISAWRPVVAIILSLPLAVLLLSPVWVASLRHKVKQPVLP